MKKNPPKPTIVQDPRAWTIDPETGLMVLEDSLEANDRAEADPDADEPADDAPTSS